MLLVHRARRLEAEVHPVSIPRRPRLPRAVLNAAAHAHTPDVARTVLAAAVQQRLVTVDLLRAALRNQANRRWHALLVVTLADIEGGAHSLPELLARRLLRRARLPAPDRCQALVRADGRYYLDLWWERQRVAVEIDGSSHMIASAWWADMLRQNEVALGDRLVLRYPSHVLREQPDRFVQQMRRALLVRTAA